MNGAPVKLIAGTTVVGPAISAGLLSRAKAPSAVIVCASAVACGNLAGADERIERGDQAARASGASRTPWAIALLKQVSPSAGVIRPG